jgi:predicted site-specific integrase-resolvase
LYVGASTVNGGIYVDPEAASEYLGVTERTLRQWAKAGKIKRERGRYDITGVNT